MNDALFEVVKLEVKDMLSNAEYESAMDEGGTYYIGKVVAFEQVLELLEGIDNGNKEV